MSSSSWNNNPNDFDSIETNSSLPRTEHFRYVFYSSSRPYSYSSLLIAATYRPKRRARGVGEDQSGEAVETSTEGDRRDERLQTLVGHNKYILLQLLCPLSHKVHFQHSMYWYNQTTLYPTSPHHLSSLLSKLNSSPPSYSTVQVPPNF